MDQDLSIETEPGRGFALSGKIMMSAILILFAVVIFLVGFHLYARWYFIRPRRLQTARRRRRRRAGGNRTHIVFYADNQRPGSSADRGLELSVLNSLPVHLYSSKTEPPLECAVCLSEFEENEVVRRIPKCDHSFHIECIDMWFHSHSTCPLCRSVVEAGEKPVLNGGEPVGNVKVTELGSSSGVTCQHEEGSGNGDTPSSDGRRKGLELVGVRIEVPPRTELENESTQNLGSPWTRLKRKLSMGKRSPTGGSGGTTPRGAGSSRVGNEVVDLESGVGGDS